MKKNFLHTIGLPLLAIALMATATLLYNSAFINSPSNINTEAFTKELHQKEKETLRLLNTLEQQAKSRGFGWAFQEHFSDYRNLFNRDGIVLLAYENDKLQFWSDNKVPVPTTRSKSLFEQPFIRLSNGYFKVIHYHAGNQQFYGLILIKSQYPFENDYLENNFQKDFKSVKNAQLVFEQQPDLPAVYAVDGAFLFSLKSKPTGDAPAWKYYVLVMMFITGVAALLVWLLRITRKLVPRIGSLGAIAFLVITVLGMRLWSLWEFFPMVLTDLELFNPAWYGTNFLFPSLGDLLLNSLIFLFLAYAITKTWRPRFKTIPASVRTQTIVSVVSISLFLLYAGFVTDLLRGLIKDSSINFEVNNLFGLDWYSFVGIFIMGLLFLSAFLLADKIMDVLVKSGMKKRHFYIVFLGVVISAIIIKHQLGVRDMIMVLWPAFLLLLTSYVHYFKKGEYAFTSILLVLFLVSFASSHTVSKYTQQKERENREVFAAKLTSDEDPVAEWEYPMLEQKIINTPWVYEPFREFSEFSQIDYEKRIRQNFFDGYWDKYEVNVHVFDADSVAIVSEPTAKRVQFDQLETIKQLFGTPTDPSPHLFYIHNSGENLSYLITLPMYQNNVFKGTLYLELTSKLIPEELGFPSLLLSKNSREIEDLSNYSHARYVNRQLINSSGDYHYPLTTSIFESIKGQGPFHYFDGYSHLFYQADDQTLIILSKPSSQILGEITAFSYLFAFFSILLVLSLFVRSLPEGIRIDALQLKTKVQLLLVSVLLLSLILFVIGTRYYIEEQYKAKNNNLISEKINSVQIEVSNKLGNEKVLNAEKQELMTKYLKKFAGVFFTDINLYDLDGRLLASSREKVFDEGLISRQINPEAWLQIGIHKRTKFIHEEEIGDMRYLSGYVPFRNKNNEILAYLNLPYFARQDALESEISTFLVAIINIFVLLFGFSIVVALFASNWITKPLRQIQQSLAGIELRKSNKPINYSGSDEIGSLVNEYNRKVAELQRNAELLARSERESAWREMAKQVAHEIKNPLTPIKLRAQHMQMSFNPDADDAEERLRNFTEMLIEQIDTLTAIANEFSNFAQMPKAHEEETDIVHLLQSAVELYKDSVEAEVTYQSAVRSPQPVMADRDQLSRVFNNLIKNAIQAIPSEQEGTVKVKLSTDKKGYLIEVKDNGTGIPEEVIERIFAPNFTTKSTGMGLGLAMVKQIVENHRGEVWFKTKKNVGTSFFVRIPYIQDAV